MAFGNLGFEDPGVSQGLADLWTLGETSLDRIATYGDGAQPGVLEPPFESFRGEWLSNEAYLFEFVGIGTDLTAAVYDTGPGLAPESVEDFEEGWGNGVFVFPSPLLASFDGLAFIQGDPETYSLLVGDTLSVTTSSGGPAASDPIAAVRAVLTGAAGTFPTGYEGINLIRLTVDLALPLAVDLAGLQTLADIIGQINAFVPGPDIAFDNGGELELRSPTEGMNSRINAEEIQSARATATNSAPYTIVDGTTLIISIDGGGNQVVTFNTADFPDIANATAFEVGQVISAQLSPGLGDDRFGLVRILSETVVGSSVEVVGGTAAAVFGFPAGAQNAPLARLGITPTDVLGSGNVDDLTAVTAQEIADLINNSAALQAIDAEMRVELDATLGGIPRLYDEIPITGSIAVSASPIQTAVNFSPTSATPIAALPSEPVEDFEDEWLANHDFFLTAADVTLTPASYDSGAPENVEDFEEEWSSNESFIFDESGLTYVLAFYSPDPLTPFVQFEDFDTVRFDVTFSVNPATDIFTSVGHLLITSTVTFTLRSEGGALPSPLVENVTYFPTVIDPNTFTVREALGGPTVDITTAGSGTLFLKYSKGAFWTEDLGI